MFNSLSCSFAQLPFMNDYPSYFISMHSWNRIVVVVGELVEMVVAGWLAGWKNCMHY
ncbi:hypothetical protein NC653_010162 [Populus alba x Populus x berolinensis]|uniref:Uncharacterized protein n=1 Tax=Populus alba x Populus x berolinensis TaxID=444605 RepID=A0AAD6QZ52_9ROSI|nr:hypothetical protein NC653_010162 [Populus alba x Populus x berolinensis]